MNMVLGFGSTEQSFEAAEEQAIREHIERRFSELALDYFTDAFAREIAAWVGERGKALQAKGDEYKAAEEYPTRYSYYWSSVVDNASHIVVILSIHHINRRHAFSPDGWAVLLTKPVFLFESIDMPRPASAIEARSDATGTGAAEGESAAPEGGDAQ